MQTKQGQNNENDDDNNIQELVFDTHYFNVFLLRALMTHPFSSASAS